MADLIKQQDELITRRKLAQFNSRPFLNNTETVKPTASSTRSAQFLDRLYNTATSLPVTTAILALVVSQGVGLNGPFWYLNYAALTLIMLTGFALLISQLSASASHTFCETVFLVVYTPLTTVFDSLVNVRDVNENNLPNKKAFKQPPVWFMQALHASVIMADSMGLTMTSIIYVCAVSTAYHFISRGFEQSSKGVAVFETTASALVVIADVVINPYGGISNALFFLLSSQVVRSHMQTAADRKTFESLEGLEKHYVNGFISIAQAFYSLIMFYQHFNFSLHILPVVYFSVYLPTQELKLAAQLIRAESLCLSNFKLAAKSEISSYDDVCAVCLMGMSHARVTPCKHLFHGKCLKNCLQKKAQCPMCNTEVL